MTSDIKSIVNIPDPYNKHARIVGVRIHPGDEAYGEFGMSEAIDWFRKRFIEAGIRYHDGQKLMLEYILDNDAGISENTKIILKTLLEKK